MTQTDDNEIDPLDGADIGETVTVRESKTLHSINYTPMTYFGTDRMVDHVEVADIEILEGDGEAEDIRITWEGEVTKRLPRRWDYHAEPVTDEEKQQHRRKKWLGRLGQGAALVFPFAIATAVATGVMNRLSGEMTINGQPVVAPSLGHLAVTVLLISLVAATVMYGMKGGFPGMVNPR